MPLTESGNINCLKCNKVFEKKFYSINQYCSITCFNKRYKGISIRWKICKKCGKDFLRNHGAIRQKYCSVVCANEGKAIKPLINEINCMVCGKHKIVLRKQYHNQVTCSRQCAVKYGKMLKYGFDYISVRDYRTEHLLKNPSCEICKWNIVPEILEVHHKDRNRSNNTRPNLILVCPNCHSIDHFKSKDGQFANNLGKLKEVA